MSANAALPSPVATAIALRFVGDLQSGKRPSIEAALDQAPPSEWPGLLQSLLIAEVNHRRARGEMPVAREYLPRFPAHIDVVRSVVPETAQAIGPVPLAPPPLPLARPAVAVTALVPPPLPSRRPVAAPLPAAILLPNEFEDIEPSPDSTPLRKRRQGGRRVAIFGILLVAVIATGGTIFATQWKRKPEAPSGGQAAVASAVVTGTPTITNLFAPKPHSADSEHELATWIVSVGGQGTLAMDGGGRRDFGPELPLPPKGKFAVTAIVLPPESSSRWSAKDLERLRSRDKLTSAKFNHPSALTDTVLEILAGSPLHLLEFNGATVAVSGAGIAPFTELESLTIQTAAAFGDADMAAIGRLSKLTSLTLNAPKITPVGLGELKKLPLRSLTFGANMVLTPEHVRILQGLPLEEFESRNGMTDDAVLEFATFQNLKRFRLQKTAITDAGLKVVLGFGMLEELQITGSAITGPGLENLSERKRLKVLDLSGGRVSDEGTEKLLALPALRELHLAGCPITDRGTMLLAQLDGIEVLDLSQTNITDKTLGTLKKHPTLKSLILTGTRVTSTAVNDFERGTPNCKVVFGSKR
jgi:hypothetical protein